MTGCDQAFRRAALLPYNINSKLNNIQKCGIIIASGREITLLRETGKTGKRGEMKKYNEIRSERIRRVRLVRLRYLSDKDCDLRNFCRKAGVDEGRMKKIETGEESEVLLTEGQKFSAILGVSSEYLTTGERTVEDKAREEVLFSPQIGSMMHAARMALKKQGNSGLKAIADKLGIHDMDLMRMEALYKSQHFKDEAFLVKVARVLNLNIDDLKDALEGSFPRGAERKETAYKGKELVIILKENSRVIRTKRLQAEVSEKDFDNLILRLEFELNLP
jgi:hypothetical protein